MKESFRKTEKLYLQENNDLSFDDNVLTGTVIQRLSYPLIFLVPTNFCIVQSWNKATVQIWIFFLRGYEIPINWRSLWNIPWRNMNLKCSVKLLRKQNQTVSCSNNESINVNNKNCYQRSSYSKPQKISWEIGKCQLLPWKTEN